MTELLYMDDCYLKEFDAKVTSLEANLVELDSTAFSPLGGGVVCDTGKIISNGKEFLVKSVVKSSGRVMHEVDTEGLKVGDSVHGIVDWDRRYKLMRLHTTAHLLSSIIYKETGALMTGGNIEPEKARDDFSVPLDKETIQKFIDEANEIIKKGAEVKIYFLSREEALKIPGIVKLAVAAPPEIKEWRIVEIVGYDIQADGGVHVKNISEIGKIVFLKLENKGKNNRRLYYTLE